MSSFCNITTAYSGKEMDHLDKMARKVNGNRRRQVQKTSNEFNKQKHRIKKTVENMKKIHGFNFFKDQDAHQNQNDRDEQLMSPVDGRRMEDKSIDNGSDDGSLGLSLSLSMDSETSSDDSEYSSISSGLESSSFSSSRGSNDSHDCISYDSISLDSISSDDKLLDHATNCKKCKRKILKLIKKRRKKRRKKRKYANMDHIDINEIDEINEERLANQFNGSKKIKIKNQTKEFIIIFFVALLIVFIIDLIMGSIKS